MNIEIQKTINLFVENLYHDSSFSGVCGTTFEELYDITKSQFKDLVINNTDIEKKEIIRLINQFNDNEFDLKRLEMILNHIDNTFETQTWLGDRFSDSVYMFQLKICEQLLPSSYGPLEVM